LAQVYTRHRLSGATIVKGESLSGLTMRATPHTSAGSYLKDCIENKGLSSGGWPGLEFSDDFGCPVLGL
jgi:hypothetical protein